MGSKAEDNFELYNDFEEALNKADFECAKEKYEESLNNIPFPKLEGSTKEIIKFGKREPRCIGPYKNLSYFEILNRVASDLVLLEGARKLFNGEVEELGIPEKVTLKLGNQGGEDLIIEFADGSIIYGEGFNASESLAKAKMRQSIEIIIRKIADKKLKVRKGVIFYNAEIECEIGKGNYFNKLEIASDVEILRNSCEVG